MTKTLLHPDTVRREVHRALVAQFEEKKADLLATHVDRFFSALAAVASYAEQEPDPETQRLVISIAVDAIRDPWQLYRSRTVREEESERRLLFAALERIAEIGIGQVGPSHEQAECARRALAAVERL